VSGFGVRIKHDIRDEILGFIFEYLPEKAELRDKNNITEKHYQ
jgi:hypothetical protein